MAGLLAEVADIDVLLQELPRAIWQARARTPATRGAITAPTVLETGFHKAIGLALDLHRGQAHVSDLSGEIRAVDLTRGTLRR